MAGSRGKKDKAYAALIALMADPGDARLINCEIVRADNDMPDESIKRFESFPQMDDRGIAIVFSSLVEIDLEKAIASHFSIPKPEATRLFSHPDGPLKEFSAKIAMGYALGVYDERMNSDLKWIMRIRNAFAHARVNLSFETPEIHDACDQLKARVESLKDRPITSSRFRFALCIHKIRNHLAISGNGHPLRFRDWPYYYTYYSEQPDQLGE
jgi:hypothetical protein